MPSTQINSTLTRAPGESASTKKRLEIIKLFVCSIKMILKRFIQVYTWYRKFYCVSLINPTKSEFGYAEIQFLGHVISEGNIQTDKTIISKILKIDRPRTKKQLQSLLGLINYYGKFIPNLASLTAPLSELLKAEQFKKANWTDSHDKVLDDIKALFSSPPILRQPDPKQTFYLQTDASGHTIASMLAQKHLGTILPCFYFSQKLTPTQQKYSTFEKEALALIVSLKKFQKYLLGQEFIILTDNLGLTKLISIDASTNARVYRWSLLIAQFKFRIEHISGKNNFIPDIMSRQGD